MNNIDGKTILDYIGLAVGKCWLLLIVYFVALAPYLIIVTGVNAFTGPAMANPETLAPSALLLFLVLFCGIIAFLLLYIVAMIALVPFFSVGYSASIATVFEGKAFSFKDLWTKGKKFYGKSMGVFGIYLLVAIPMSIVFVVVLFVALFATAGNNPEMMTGAYIYSNPFFLVSLFLFSIVSALLSLWNISANTAIATGKEKFSKYLTAPFRFVGRFPEYMIIFFIVYIIYSLAVVAINILLSIIVPYGDWISTIISAIMSPIVYYISIIFLTAVAFKYYNENSDAGEPTPETTPLTD